MNNITSMRRWRAGAWLALAVGLAQPAMAAWMKAETDHFTIHAEGDEQALRRHATQLEKFHQAALLMLGIPDGKARTQRRFDVVMLRDAERLSAVRPGIKGYAGLYLQCADGAVAFAAEAAGTLRVEDDFGQVVLFHEVAHRLMFEYSNRIHPRWFVEGFAEYMSRTRLDGDRITFGKAPPYASARLFRQAADATARWEDVLRSTTATPKTEADFYLKAWLLTHYMFNDSARVQQLHQYMDRVADGEDAVLAFEVTTGLTMAELPVLLERYLRTAPALRLSGQESRAIGVKVTAIDEAQGEVLLKAVTLRTCPAKSHGETLLAELRKLRQQRAVPVIELRLALARAELLYGDPTAAQAELTTVLAEDEANFEAHHLLGRALTVLASRLSGEERDAHLSQARARYFSAYRLNKLDAPNLYRLAQALAHRGQDASLLNAARGAATLEPTVPDYAFLEAQVDLRAGDWERAIRALRPLASNPHDANFAARMRLVIVAIQASKGSADIAGMLMQRE